MFRRETADCSNYDLLLENAKRMRFNPTEAEAVAWALLRKAFPKTKFRRQHIIGNFIVDFVCFKHNLVIEIDGEYHLEEKQIEDDERRSAQLETFNLQVIRFSNDEILLDPESVIRKLKNYINE